MKNIEVLSVGPFYAPSYETMERDFIVHKLWQAKDRAALIAEVGGRVRAIQTGGGHGADAKLMDALPKLEIIACFGVGVDADHLKCGVGIDHLLVLLVLEAVLLDVVPELLGELRARERLRADDGGKGGIRLYRLHERGVWFTS